MITNIKVENFRCYKNLDIALKDGRGRLRNEWILFGVNFSGKSSFMEIFAFLKRSAEALLIESLRDERPNFDMESYDMTKEIQLHKRAGSQCPMSLEYELLVDKYELRYRMIFDDEGLVEESLCRKVSNNYSAIFEFKDNVLTWDNRILDSYYINIVNKMFEKYQYNHTVLSILVLGRDERSNSKLLIHPSLRAFSHFGENMFVNVGSYSSLKVESYLRNCNRGAFTGVVVPEYIELLKKAAPLINSIIKKIFPVVNRVEYKISDEDNGYKKYEVQIYFNNHKGSSLIVQDNVPEIFEELFGILHNIIGLDSNLYFVMDNFVESVSGFSLVEIFEKVMPLTETKGIFAMTGVEAMNIVDRSSIILAWVDEGVFKANTLNNITTLQANHNVQNRFERGLIVPMIRSKDNNLLETLCEYKKTQRK